MHQKEAQQDKVQQNENEQMNDQFFNAVIEKIDLQKLLGKSKQQYVAMRNLQKWMHNHASSDWKIVDNINNMVFAKEFFDIMDE